MAVQVIQGDACAVLATLPPKSAQMCVTSPPYWGLRDYGVPGQFGLEKMPEEYVGKLVEVFRLVREALADDGTLWLNLGDNYANDTKWGGRKRSTGLKSKDLVGIPWRVAFALQADGWYLRSDIIWSKPNPMPESVTDRPTRSHEYIFLLTKNRKYYYDADAIKEPLTCLRKRGRGPMVAEGTGRNDAATGTRGDYRDKQSGHGPRHAGFNARYFGSSKPYTGQATKDFATAGAQDASATKARIVDAILAGGITARNKRTVWTVTPKSFKGAHFATFPPALIEPCILAGSRPGDTVLDPFGGAGTTGVVAQAHGRNAVLIELNPAYGEMATRRIADAQLDPAWAKMLG